MWQFRSKSELIRFVKRFAPYKKKRDHNSRSPLPIVDEKVRREKALDFSGCNSRPGTGSFHPVAIETTAEATKLSELSV